MLAVALESAHPIPAQIDLAPSAVSGRAVTGGRGAATAAAASRSGCGRVPRAPGGCAARRAPRRRDGAASAAPGHRGRRRRRRRGRCAARRCGGGAARACDGPRAACGRCRVRLSAATRASSSATSWAWRSVSGAAAASMSALSSAHSATTVVPVPSSRWGIGREGGSALHEVGVAGQDTGPGEVALGRMRRAARPASAGTPSATSTSRTIAVGDRGELDAHAPRGDGDQLGRHLVGEHDEHRAGRRLLDGLQQPGGALGVEQVELVRGSSPCGCPPRAPATRCG